MNKLATQEWFQINDTQISKCHHSALETATLFIYKQSDENE